MPVAEHPRKRTKAEAGLLGARAKWGDHVPRVVRMDDLTDDQARLVHALIAAARAEREKADPAVATPDRPEEEEPHDRRSATRG